MTRLLALLLALSCLASAKEQAVHWSDLNQLLTGQEVAVCLSDGTRVQGRTAAVQADSLVVGTSRGPQSIPRPALQEIRLRQKAGYKGRLLGTAIGAGAGTAVAVPVLRYARNEGSSTFQGVAARLIVALAVLGYVSGWSADRRGDLIRILPD